MYIDVIKNRVYLYAIAIFITLFALFSIFFIKLNYGIDMTGGIQLEYSYEKDIDIELTRSKVEEETKLLLYQGKTIVNAAHTYKIS